MSIVNLFKRITFTALFFISAILSGCNSGTSEEANTTPQTGVVVTEIHITTNSTTLAKNQPSQLKATATYSNGSTADVTNSVTWQSSDNNIASFIGAGVLEGVKSGFVDVTAQFNNITSNTVNIEVTSVTLQRLQITPTSIVLAKGLTQPIKVMATYSDSTSSDITAFVSWVFTNTKIATTNSAGVVTGVNTGNTKASASYNGVKSNTIDIDVTPAVISAITISPSPLQITIGTKQPLVATATFSDGKTTNITTSANWNSTNYRVVTVNNQGVITGKAIGNSVITASLNGITSSNLNVQVINAAPQSIQIAPTQLLLHKGQTQALTANGIYSDGSTANITTKVSWSTSNTNIATVNTKGIVTGVNTGKTQIIASLDGITSTVTVITKAYAKPTFIETNEEKIQREKIKTIYDELMAYYDGSANNVVEGASNQYVIAPNLSKDSSGDFVHTEGVYKPEFKAFMLKWYAFFKAVAQRPNPEYKASFDKNAERAAYLFSASGSFDHYMTRQPFRGYVEKAGIDLNSSLFKDGQKAAMESSIFGHSAYSWFHDTVQMQFTEGKKPDQPYTNPDKHGNKRKLALTNYGGVSQVGHRLLNLAKDFKYVGIGYNAFKSYADRVFTGNSFYPVGRKAEGFRDFSAFPHGYFPLQAELRVLRKRQKDGLFLKKYPQGFESISYQTYHVTTWSISHIASHTFTEGKNIKITIRDTDKNGRILSEMKMPLRKGGGKVGTDGSLIKAFYAPGHYRADGWAFFFKPKYGVISGALKTVLADPTQKIVFHITISGDAVTAKTGNPDTPLQYRIIYYDLDN
ncbi:hypothetical protein A3K86_19945 [Photobacterium jeanii]|uniref:BIG2 domain-containing protein n=1 Tax=Photobacterium jeanii TaxID=858640 RepID=A0A178K3E1_9GAMM|nr:Ig-like domain-containing protein [Photobacterium jeanii]OAN11233.1 hypothetical protein A3K86_19945 [Photobacterium jeanii]PST90752.1 hypothetical protein C9I91_09055 [Photobacterium jeanii]